jgi:hypothetical protein
MSQNLQTLEAVSKHQPAQTNNGDDSESDDNSRSINQNF